MIKSIIALTILLTGLYYTYEHIKNRIIEECKAKREHERLSKELKDKYKVDVLVGLKKKDMRYADDNYSTRFKVAYKDVVLIERGILNALSKYSFETLIKLPKIYSIVYKMEDHKKGTVIYAETVYPDNIIVVSSVAPFESVKEVEAVIHHELFHVLTWDWKDEYKEFSEVDNSLINEEYKENVEEEAADNWAYGFFCKDNAKSNYLHWKYKNWTVAYN